MNWLQLAQRLQLISQAGLTYCENKYDLERYREIQQIVKDIFEDKLQSNSPEIENWVLSEKGYFTPKVDIRACVFKDNKILMVHEMIDNHWSLPGGWADAGLSPYENAVKEVYEEAGIKVKPLRLLAVMDKKMHNHPPDVFYCYKLFIHCEYISGDFKENNETSEAKYFALNELPPLSVPRNTKEQIELIFKLAGDKDFNVYCD